MNKYTEMQLIYMHLLKHGSITRLECFKAYKFYNLPGRIWDLRRFLAEKGSKYSITKTMIPENGKRFARYSLEG
jgi:hypothetical protein